MGERRAYRRQPSQKTTGLTVPLGSGVQKMCTETLHCWPTSLRTGFFTYKMVFNFLHRILIKREMQYI